ncbi:MAG: hypothetical protein ABH842_06150 [Candidatus Micrarchaeota archaeon]
MVRAIFFGRVEGASTVARFANLPETGVKLDTIRQRLRTWKRLGEMRNYPTWIVEDIKRTRTTAIDEIDQKKKTLEKDIEQSMQRGALTREFFVCEGPSGETSLGFTVQLTKDVTTMTRRNEKGEFEVVAIPNDDYKKLKRRRIEDKISKYAFVCCAALSTLAAYLASDFWFGATTFLELGVLRLIHKTILHLSPVFRAFKGTEHTDFVLRFLDDTKRVILENLRKLEDGIRKSN